MYVCECKYVCLCSQKARQCAFPVITNPLMTSLSLEDLGS